MNSPEESDWAGEMARSPAEIVTPVMGCCFRGSESSTRTAPRRESGFCRCQRMSATTGRRSVSERRGGREFSFLLGAGQPENGDGEGPLQCSQRRHDQGVASSIAATGFGLTALCIGDQRGFISDRVRAGARLVHAALSVEETAQPPRIFLPLRQPRNRGAHVRLRSVFGGYGHSALRGSYLPRTLPSSGSRRTGESDLQPRGLDWLSEDTSLLNPWMDSGSRISASRWDYYSELMMMYLLGMGSSAHP
jgi:hypothetical protein